MKDLEGRVAVVAGATRGAEHGIATMLGEAGATVYCTGRSVRGQPATEGRTETIEETAELVSELGGRGVWVQADHGVEEQVEALFARVTQDEGRLDVLVNDVWGATPLPSGANRSGSSPARKAWPCSGRRCTRTSSPAGTASRS